MITLEHNWIEALAKAYAPSTCKRRIKAIEALIREGKARVKPELTEQQQVYLNGGY